MSLVNRFQIRLAEESDLPSVTALLKETARWIQRKGIVQWEYLLEEGAEAEIASSISQKETFLVWDGQTAAATVNLSTQPNDWDRFLYGEQADEPALYIHRLAVRPQYSGRGIGRELMQWIEEFAAREFLLLKLDCAGKNPALDKFYTSCGFVFAGNCHGQHLYRKNIEKKA